MAILTADTNGKVQGKFRIPANVPAGAKRVDFIGAASRAIGTFTGQGNLQTSIFQDITTVTTSRWFVSIDPLAQTFTLDKDTQIAGIDLCFTAAGSAVRVQLRHTQNGFPDKRVLADVELPQSSILTNGKYTRALFTSPVRVTAGEEYAFVVLCDDATTACAIAEVGKFDAKKQTWVTAQPYTVGNLLSSSNASTWLAHPDKDLTFRILEADFTAPVREIAMGKVYLDNITDMMLFSVAESPTSATRVEYELELPSGVKNRVAHGQVVRFAEKVSGNAAIKAILSGTQKASPVLWPGTELVMGEVAQTAEYFTRSIPATGAKKAVLVYDAIIPSGASVTASIQKDSNTWEACTPDGTTPQGDGLVEFRFKNALSSVNSVKVRLELSGTTTARPRVRNIRLMALA